MKQTVQSFNLGKSTVVTLPKHLGIKPGKKFLVKKQNGDLILSIVREKEDPVAKIVRLAGGANFKEAFGKELSPDDLSKLYDKQYEDLLR